MRIDDFMNENEITELRKKTLSSYVSKRLARNPNLMTAPAIGKTKKQKSGVELAMDKMIPGSAIRKPRVEPQENVEVIPEADATDTVTMDVPLLIRIMEYAREDAKTDMDLHDVAEKLIELSKHHDYLCMDNYNEIVGVKEQVDEGITDIVQNVKTKINKAIFVGKKEYQETKKATNIALNWNKATDEQKSFAINQLKDVAKLSAGIIVGSIAGKYLLTKGAVAVLGHSGGHVAAAHAAGGHAARLALAKKAAEVTAEEAANHIVGEVAIETGIIGAGLAGAKHLEKFLENLIKTSAAHKFDEIQKKLAARKEKQQSTLPAVKEDDMEESNAFTDARMNAIKAGKKSFSVGGKTYPVTGDTSDEREAIANEDIEESCPHCGGLMLPETRLNEKKDACYYKVKSRYKVWPSAYASGALVKCRKAGAKNWGNKSK